MKQRFYILGCFLTIMSVLYPDMASSMPIGIHKIIAYEASLLQEVPSEIRVYRGNLESCPSHFKETICEGTYDEDADRDPRLNPGDPNSWYLMLNWGTHFWNPEGGPEGGLLTRIGDLPVNLDSKNAYQRADDLFNQAVSIYSSNPSLAYYLLGRVIHLVVDMATPAHVHLDPHIGDSTSTGDDSLEEYLDFLYGDNIAGIERFRRDFPINKLGEFDHKKFDASYTLESPLYKIFYLMAATSKAFDSDDADGQNDRGGRRGRSINAVKNISNLQYVWTIRDNSLKKSFLSDYQISKARNKIILKNFLLSRLDKTYDSIRIDFSDGYEIYNLREFKKTDIGDKDLQEISSTLIPAAILSSAEIYRLFWLITHPTLSKDDSVMIVLNKSEEKIYISRPEPIKIAIDISSRGWNGIDTEVYAWLDAIVKGDKVMLYFNNGSWVPFKDYQDMRPAIALFKLHDVHGFIWTVVEETFSISDDVLFNINLCIDRKIDGIYTPSESICNGIPLKIN